MISEVYYSNLHKWRPSWIPMPFREFPWLTHFYDQNTLHMYIDQYFRFLGKGGHLEKKAILKKTK